MKNDLNFTNQNSSIKQLGYQFEFDIQIISIKIDYKAQFNFKILIKRGSKQNEIDRIFKYNPYLDNEIPINEEFSIVSVLNPMENSNFDFDKNKVFHDKLYKIYLCIYTKSGFKPAISGEFNLSNFINDDNINTLVLSNKTFNEVIIKFKINCKYVSEHDSLSVYNNFNNEFHDDKGETNKIETNSNYEEILEKKYVNTLSTNRSNSIFSSILKEDYNIIGKNKSDSESNYQNQIAKTSYDIKESNNIQIINSNINESNLKLELNNNIITNASNWKEGINNY